MTHSRITFQARVLTLSLTAALALGSSGEGEASRRAEANGLTRTAAKRFAFHYAPSLSNEEIGWYSQFDLLVTHDPLPRDQVERLRRAGTKLVLYEWAVAFYESRATPWQNSLRGRADLLNSRPLTGGSGSASPAWYFDPNTHAHHFDRAEDVARRMRDAGYDGVFFDATTASNVHSEALAEYGRRQPHIAYDEAFSRFLRELRRKMPEAILFTNQGYRRAQHYLPYVDWDLTESLIAAPSDVRPWANAGAPANTISVAMTNVAAIAQRYPHVRFAHLNYSGGEGSSDVIRLVVGVSQLFGGEGYVGSATNDRADLIYFRNPGRPAGDRIELPDGKGAYRVYENGIIAISAGTEEVVIDHRQNTPLRNHVTGESVGGRTITLPPSDGIPRAYFFDFVRALPS